MARDNSAKLMIMTKEDTKLLIQDLLARLPYSVMCDCPRGSWVIPSAVDVIDSTVYYPCWGEWRPVSECKPYLRELSDMTEEERGKSWSDFVLTTDRLTHRSSDLKTMVLLS